MGLDMYLYRKICVGAPYEHNEVKGIIDITKEGKKLPIDLSKVSEVAEEIAYWRKANAIHKWFVDNVQDGNDDCREHYLELADLERLLNLCKEVKKKAIIKDDVVKNAKEISALLPTQEGFFFGSTNYDEFYMDDIDYTIETLTEIIEEGHKNIQYYDYYYRSSW